MEYIHIDTCPVCGNSHSELANTCIDHYATGEKFDIFRCTNCGFLFTQDFPSENNIGRYYDTKDYISHSDTNKGIVNKLYHVVRKRMMKKKADIVRTHTHSSAPWLLDIGCGIGVFLSEMSKRGWAVKGIEKNKEAREFAHKNFGVAVSDSEMLDKFEESSFGVITLWHSLEHLERLNETLKSIHKLLVENGTAFIAVPNAASEDAAYYKEMWAAYDVPRHLWHFTPETMRLLVEKNGFGIEKIYPMPFDAFYVSMLTEKYKNNKLHFLSGAFIGLKCFFKASKNPGKSSSIIYVLKKAETVNFRV
jgi:2-polyprenyl-3-methyl-5-hydroxy-6-metoxy-1,4-benzoquinol methylase